MHPVKHQKGHVSTMHTQNKPIKKKTDQALHWAYENNSTVRRI